VNRIVFQCSTCDRVYDRKHVTDWGRHQESLHVGSSAVCTALVPDHLGSGQLCRGQLVARQATADELKLEADAEAGAAVSPIVKPRPIAL
jgi:hypothetical protein